MYVFEGVSNSMMYKYPSRKKPSLPITIFIVFLTLLIICSIVSDIKKKRQLSHYQDSLSYFQETSIEQIMLQSSNKNNFILYIGRENCPYCLEFLPNFVDILKAVSKEYSNKLNCKFLYVNSRDTDKNLFLKAFREKCEISYVPSIVVFYNNKYYKLDSPQTQRGFDYTKIQKIWRNIYVQPGRINAILCLSDMCVWYYTLNSCKRYF